MRTLKVLIDGLAFPEGPRWHDGKFYFSDMHAHQVIAADMAGKREVVCEVPGRPSGLGWLPDGRMLVVSMTDRKLMRLDRDGLKTVTARIVANEMMFPNGAVITPDGKTLVVGESFGRRLTAFDIGADGSLTNRRVWAELGNGIPDGICLDAENAIWVACPTASEVIRVKQGGEVAERIKVETDAFACMLGGPDGRMLFVATAPGSDPEKCRADRRGRIETTHVEVPRAGLP
ncbi:MAG: SMP-30/gluconolactonase/LRE family protein [Candidatus Binatus sp.]